MSLTTAVGLSVAPAGAAVVAIVSGVNWTNGNWAEVIASAAGTIAVAGVMHEDVSAGGQFEIAIGVGAAAAETEVSALRLRILNNEGGHNIIMLPVPLVVATTGQRVSLRLRSASATTLNVGLLYYLNLDSDHVFTATTSPLTSLPSGSASFALTPNATEWANTDWLELTSGLDREIALVGLTFYRAATGATDYEWDLATGAAGAETVITTIRAASKASTANSARGSYAFLPVVHPLPADTRIATRLRKSGTNATAIDVALVYYGPTDLFPKPLYTETRPTGGEGLCEKVRIHTWLEWNLA